MNILKRMLYSVAFIFSVVLLCPFRVNAQFMPPMLPNSGAEQAVSTMTTLMLRDMVQSLGIDMPLDDYKNAFRIMTGQSYDDSFNFTYLNANDVQWDMLNFYDSNGNLVPKDDCIIAFGNNSQGLTTYFTYSSQTGEILNVGEDFVSSESSLNGHYTDEFKNLVTQVTSPIMNGQQSAIYNPANIDSDMREYLEEQPFFMYAMSADHSFGVIVPNACSPDVVCTPHYNTPNVYEYSASGSQATNVPQIYANNENGVYWLAGSYTLVERNSSIYGHTFNLVGSYYPGFYPMWQGGVLRYRLPTQAQYQQVVDNIGSDFSDVIYPTITEPYNIPNDVNYQKMRNAIYNKNYEVNNHYDYSQPINVYNYPLNITVPNPPDVTPTNNYYETIYNYYTMPKVDEELEADPELIGNNVPILSNLQNRFPFSIPWDIARIFDSLSVEREAPVIDAEIYFPIIDYTWNCSIDLTMFEDVAEVVRKCILILFIVGLAVFSYSHHFGS